MVKWSELQKGRLFGHPIHLMLVHFPSALFPFSLILDLIGVFSGNGSWFAASVVCMIGGVAFGMLAACFGFMDYLRIPSSDAVATAGRHALIQTCVLFLFAIVAGVRLIHSPFFPPSLWLLLAEAATVLLLVYGNYQGGELVLRYGIGRVPGSGIDKSDRHDPG